MDWVVHVSSHGTQPNGCCFGTNVTIGPFSDADLAEARARIEEADPRDREVEATVAPLFPPTTKPGGLHPFEKESEAAQSPEVGV